MSEVKVTANKTGQVLIQSENNTEYGYVRVEQILMEINEAGFMRPSVRSVLIKSTMVHLKTAKFFRGQVLPGKIVYKESMEPFSKAEHSDKELKIAGKTGIVCTLNGEPIYRRAVYTTNPLVVDVLIAHDNQEEIRLAQQYLNSSTEVTEEVVLDVQGAELS